MEEQELRILVEKATYQKMMDQFKKLNVNELNHFRDYIHSLEQSEYRKFMQTVYVNLLYDKEIDEAGGF